MYMYVHFTNKKFKIKKRENIFIFKRNMLISDTSKIKIFLDGTRKTYILLRSKNKFISNL